MSADPPFSSVRYLPTTEAYDRWAAVYDSDGNFLQAMDSQEMRTLLPRFLSLLPDGPGPRRLVDLGCGTGRNTALLLPVPDAEIVAVDASRGMLDVARGRLQALSQASGDTDKPTTTAAPANHLRFEVLDLLAAPDAPPPAALQGAHGVVSTLVVEHVPLAVFFAQASRMLRPGGVLLLTNMHAHMGGISQAGFVDPATGHKIRPTSYAHTVADVVAEAAGCGLYVVGGDGGGIKERAVTDDDVESLGPRSGKWVGVTCWFGGLFRKSQEEEEEGPEK